MTPFIAIGYFLAVAFMIFVYADQTQTVVLLARKLVELDRETEKLKFEIEKLKLLSRAVDGSLRDHLREHAAPIMRGLLPPPSRR